MKGCFITIFKHWFWSLVVLCCIVVVVQCARDAEQEFTRTYVKWSLSFGWTEKAASLMHDYFVESRYANENRVTKQDGALAEEVISGCLEKDDIKSAQRVYRDYHKGLNDFSRMDVFKYMVEHNLPDSLDYKEKSLHY